MLEKVPLVYFVGLIPGKYLALFPVFIIGANDQTLTFTVSVESVDNKTWETLGQNMAHDPAFDEIRKEYTTKEVIFRIHQREFREKVLHAYLEHCSICSLRHRELLDAAHIVPDSKGGIANVTNGISLCKIHHSAFDKNILGVNEDYRVEVRKDILEEIDGPMLRYGLQEMHHKKIILPRSKWYLPDKRFIRERYDQFIKAS